MLKIKIATFFLLTPLLILGCQTTKTNRQLETTQSSPQTIASEKVVRENQSPLTQSYAAFRKQQINAVKYGLSIDITGKEKYSGIVTIHMDLNKNNVSEVTFDFNGGEVSNTTVNGKTVPFVYNDFYVSMAPEHFIPGKNTVQISYSRSYDKDGTGLHRFEETSSGKSYLYTDFQPYHANELFPHFDQPNLRTTYTLDVKAPADWYVISSTRETRIDDLGETKHWHFPESANFASYIFSLHAGPFQVWEDDHKGIPLRLFAREEMAQYVVLEDWFGPTKNSLDFFNDYFGIPYPYMKYDQLILPDYNAGAMENVAAVTFTERFLSRGTPTRAEKKSIANVVAHEAAHMWFGNLVTPDWWNGLWLNEAFATHMANLATETIYSDIWEDFYRRTKDWAYWTDDGVNTHPIELPVENTSEAFTNFDGITYGKGSSVLRQLSYYLGEDVYQKGVSSHLKKYAEQAATMAQFITVLEETSKQDLTQWKKDWLLTSGLNQVLVAFSCEQDKISQFKILQTAPEEHPILRTQKTQIALYQLQDDSLKLYDKTAVTYSGASTEVKELVGKSCPDAVYPNYEDYAYVRVLLDEKTINTVSKHINGFPENITRLMLWQSLADGMDEARLPVTDYVNFAVSNIPQEQVDTINRNVYGNLTSAASYLYGSVATNSKAKQALINIEHFFQNRLQSAQPGSDLQQSAFNSFVSTVHSPKGLNYLSAMLSGSEEVSGLELDQDKRWRIVYRLNRFAWGDYESILQAELERDPSDYGNKRAEASRVVRPDIKTKELWLDRLLNEPEAQSFDLAKNIFRALFPVQQQEIHAKYAERIMLAIPELATKAEPQYVAYLAGTILPAHCNTQSAAWFKQYMPLYKDLDPQIVKAVKVMAQENERCIAVNKLLQ